MDRVDWIPVDVLADIIVELAGIDKPATEGVTKSSSTVQVYHVVNPEDVNWLTLLPIVVRKFGSSTKVVSWDEWVDTLRESQESISLVDLKQNPGLKLLDFFERLKVDTGETSRGLVLDVELSTGKSKTLAGLGAVNEECMERWLTQWGY